MDGGFSRRKASPSIVAIACCFDLLCYESTIEEACFDPIHPKAARPIARLRVFQRIVRDHNSAACPTLVINDGAVAQSNVEDVRSDKAWRFIERCWALPGPNLFLDTHIFKKGVPPWIRAERPCAWRPAKRSLSTSFIAVEAIAPGSDEEARDALGNGMGLRDLLSYPGDRRYQD